MHRLLAPTENNLKIAVEYLKSDIPIAFPTETVYGLGGNAYSDKAVANLFIYKNRPKFNPISICYQSIEQASKDLIITENAIKLATHLLPGPITIVLQKRSDSKLSLLCSPDIETIGMRIPNNDIALKLLSMISFPLAAPSANKSANFSPTTAELVSDNFKDINNLIILNGGHSDLGIESTIIDCSKNIPYILRSGAISAEEIMKKCNMEISKHNETVNISTTKHYQSSKKILLNVTEALDSDAILAFGPPFRNNSKHLLNLSLTGNLNEAAANFFTMLNELTKTDVQRICVMPIPNNGIGAALNDRLLKAAGITKKT